MDTQVAPNEAPVAASGPGEWVTIVWDDPVNLMSYVTYVFMRHFGYSEAKATRLMLQVHHTGSAIVSRGPRERMEADVAAMHAAGLLSSLREASGA